MHKYFFILISLFFFGRVNAQNKTVVTQAKKTKDVLVEVSTIHGKMVFKLYNETPLHKANFIKLTKEGFFNDLLFHRIIREFMIQGGDPDSRTAVPGQQLGNGGPGYNVSAEFNDKFIHKKGALSAARMGDYVNPKKESSGSQFYIVQGRKYSDSELSNFEQQTSIKYTSEQRIAYKTLGGTPHLDRNYTVFGEMISGFEVLDKLASVPTQPGDRPVENLKMQIKMLK